MMEQRRSPMTFAKSFREAFYFVVFISVFSIVGCASHNMNQANDIRPARDIKWTLQDMDGHGVDGFAHVWVRFDSDGKVYGSGGCNSFRGYYSLENGIVKTGPLATTRKACSSLLNVQESEILQTIENIDVAYKRGDRLFIEGSNHKLLFSR
jgi:heat shock protein HslJ